MNSAVTVSPDWGNELRFANSESKSVGLQGNALKIIQDNAPRIVAGLKLGGDLSVGLSLNPLLMGYTAFAGLGRVLQLVYGTKDNQKKVAAEHAANKDELPTTTIGKVLRPREYPVEAGAGLSTIAESFGVAYGVTQFMDGGTGFTPLILGAIAMWSYANILFGVEKKNDEKSDTEKSESLVFAQSESKPLGLWGKVKNMFKDNPVLVSSLTQLGISVGMLVGGLLEGLSAYSIPAGFFIAANVIQALFVRKQEFNVEGAQNTAKQDKSFADRVSEEQQQRGPWGVQAT